MTVDTDPTIYILPVLFDFGSKKTIFTLMSFVDIRLLITL